MSDLKVDYYTLEDTEATLGRLKTEFEDLDGNVEDHKHIWGHGDVRDAMGEFAGNMDHHRKKLIGKIETCRDKVANTLETFRKTDEELAKSFDEERPA